MPVFYKTLFARELSHLLKVEKLKETTHCVSVIRLAKEMPVFEHSIARQDSQPLSWSGAIWLTQPHISRGACSHFHSCAAYRYQNANSLKDDKAGLGCYFKGKKKISLQHSSTGLHQKLQGMAFRQRLAAPPMLIYSLSYSELYIRQRM